MALTRDYLNYLDNMVDIAPANSQEELIAAQEIASLMQSHGVETRIEEFDASAWGRLPYHILYILLFLGVFSAGLGGSVGVVGTLLAVVVAIILVLDYRGMDLFKNFGPSARSQNVVAYHKATGPLVTKGVRPIVIVAHYDTPKESFLRSTPLTRYIPLLSKISPWCAIAGGVVALFERFGFLPEAFRRVLWIIALIAVLPILLMGIGALAERFSSCTEGANDNKSGVAAMLGVLEDVHPTGVVPEPVRIRERPLFEEDNLTDEEESFEIPRGEKLDKDGFVVTDNTQTAADANKTSGANTAYVDDEFSDLTSDVNAEAHEQQKKPFFSFITDLFKPREQEADEHEFAEYGEEFDEFTDEAEELTPFTPAAEVHSNIASIEHISQPEVTTHVENFTVEAQTTADEPKTERFVNGTPATVFTAAAAAGTIRHGKDVIEQLGILPRSCEVEYIEPPMAVSQVPVGVEPPTPEEVEKKSLWARFLEGLGFEPKTKDASIDDYEENEANLFDNEEELAEQELAAPKQGFLSRLGLNDANSSKEAPKKSFFQRLFGSDDVVEAYDEIDYSEEDLVPLPEDAFASTSAPIRGVEDTIMSPVAPVHEDLANDLAFELSNTQPSQDEVVVLTTNEQGEEAANDNKKEASEQLKHVNTSSAVEQDSKLEFEVTPVEGANLNELRPPVTASIKEDNTEPEFVLTQNEQETSNVASNNQPQEKATRPQEEATKERSGGFWSFIQKAVDFIAPIEEEDEEVDAEKTVVSEEASIPADNNAPAPRRISELPHKEDALVITKELTEEDTEELTEEEEQKPDLTIMAPLESFTEANNFKSRVPNIGDTGETQATVSPDATVSITREQLLQNGRFALDFDDNSSNEEFDEGDQTGLDNTGDVFEPADEEVPQAEPRIRPDKPEDTDWGESSFTPATIDVARRAALFDLPDPSENEADPFVSDADMTRIQPKNTASSNTVKSEKDQNPSDAQTGSFVEWLGVDEDFDAKTSGRKIGSWENFSSDDEWKGGATTREGLRGDDEYRSESEAIHNFFNETRMVVESFDEQTPDLEAAEDERGQNSEKTLEDIEKENEQLEAETERVEEAEESKTTQEQATVGEDAYGEPAAEVEVEASNNKEEQSEDSTPLEEELREAVLSLNDDALQCHDIWFVALGAADRNHAGMQAFLAEHRSDIRGAFLINLDSVGAGNLTLLSNEGLGTTRRADRRMTRIIKKIAQDLHVELAELPYDWATTDATPAMRKSVRGLTVMGTDESGMSALSHTQDDVIENLDLSQVALVNDLVTELIRRS